MKRTMLVLAGMAVLALACGEADLAGGEEIATTNADLAEPWNSMGLPVGTAEVIVSDATVALLGYDGGDFASLSASWESAWSTGGWTQADRFSETDFLAGIYTKGSQEVGWAIGADQGVVLVYLEDLTLVPAEASTVRQAKTGTRRLTRGTRPSAGSGGGGRGGSTPKAGGAMPKAGAGGGGGGGGGAAPGGGSRPGGSGGSMPR